MSDRFGVSYTAQARRALEVDLPEDTSAATLEFIDGVLRADPTSVGEPVTEEPEPEYAARVGDYWVTYRVVQDTTTQAAVADSSGADGSGAGAGVADAAGADAAGALDPGDDDDRVDDEIQGDSTPVAAPHAAEGIPARTASGPVVVARPGDSGPIRRASGPVVIPAAGREPSDPSPIVRRATGAVPIAGRAATTGEPPLVGETTPPLPTRHRAAAPAELPEPTRALDRWFELHGSASLWIVPVIAFAALVTGLAIAAAPVTAGESAVTGLVWDVTAYGRLTTAAAWWQQSPLGWLQLAAWVELTGGFGRWSPAVLAVREALVPVAAATAGLVWLLARRVGAGRVAATVAAVFAAVAPVALSVHVTASAQPVGAMWLLAALFVATIRRRPVAVGIVAGLLFSLAVLSAAASLLARPVLAWVLVRSAGPRGRVAALAGAAGAFLIATALVELVLSALSSDQTAPLAEGGPLGIALWWQVDPVLLVVSAVAGVYALTFRRLRPWAALVVGGLIALSIPGLAPASGVALVVPFAIVVVAAIADEAVRAIRGGGAPRRVEPIAVVAVLGAATVAVAAASIIRLPAAFGPPAVDASQQAEAWLVANTAPGSPVLVDASMRVDLLEAGWGRDDVTTYDAASGSLPDRWTDAAWAVVPARLAETADADSLVAATFDPYTVRRVVPGGVATAEASEAARAQLRQQLGEQLAANDQLVMADADRALLAQGEVDDRIVSVLGALTGFGAVQVAGFPAVDGESGARRQVALTTAYGDPLVDDGAPTAAARALLAGLLDQYAPATTFAQDGALVLRYPPTLGVPAG